MIANGDCYQVAGQFIFDATIAQQADGYTLVHGCVSGQGSLEGQRINHAWVEIDDGPQVMVIDLSQGGDLVLPRDTYYRIGQIESTESVRFEPEAVLVLMLRHRHWGPWEKS